MVDGQVKSFFDGAIRWKELSHPDNAFTFEVTFLLSHPFLADLTASGLKPPLHFHPYQTEYIQVVTGRLFVEVNGEERMLTPADGRFAIQPGTNHRLYHPPASEGKDGGRVVFLLSAESTPEAFQLDALFFQNWYGYQQDMQARHAGALNIIQVMSMFDAGSSYLSPPSWLPFGQTLSRCVSIIIGRYIGSFLGYQPFYRKYTTDWDVACKRMESSLFQRRFAKSEKQF